MSTAFSQTTRSLAADSARPALFAWGIAALLLAAWCAWFLLGRVTLAQVSTQARLELRQSAQPLAAAAAGRVRAHRLVLGQQVQAGEVLVELDGDTARAHLAEAQARQAAVAAELAALAAELQRREQATGLEERAAEAAQQAAQARVKEGAGTLAHAVEQAQRLAAEAAAGGVPQAEARQAEAEARRLAAARQALIADAQRLHAAGATRVAELRSQSEALRRQQAALQGEQAMLAASLARLQADVELQLVRAPASGRVADVAPLRAGDVVTPGQRFGTLLPAGELIVAADFDPATAFGHLKPGQAARLRLAGFAWTEYGSVPATVARVAGELRDGRLHVELVPAAAPNPALPLQHGLPGTVEVDIERVAPVMLLLRAAGQWLATPPAP